MPHCIEDTGGFFVLTPWDDPAYAGRFVEGCQAAGIPVEEVPIQQMLKEEPLLDPHIRQCFRVPDASADSFLAADLNAESARQHGAVVLNYHQTLALLKSSPEGGARVAGARVLDLVKDETLEIYADLVVNAAGAWAGQIAASAGANVKIIPGKGTMVAVNHRIVNTVINRCKLPGDGDILVPAHTVAVIGTTDVKVEDPDHFAIEPWEIQLMLEEGEKLVPGFRQMRMLRAWAGVRPLYQETKTPEETGDNRQVTRAFVLLDHSVRDGVEGLVTITSGKWTTYRKMAEATVDLVCKKLGVQRECRTHLEPLPGGEKPGYHIRGGRLAEVEAAEAYGSLVCECELVTIEDVKRAIQAGAKTIDDIRRDVRVGMGPCQGGFCTYRVAGMLHAERKQAVEASNVALRDFLQERWKGLLPVLWGQQLRQERLDELIYLDVLNADHLPGPEASPLGPVMYEATEDERRRTEDGGGQAAGNRVPRAEPDRGGTSPVKTERAPFIGDRMPTGAKPGAVDVLVIGAGLAGLAAAWQIARRGKSVHVIAKGWGANHWSAGCVDVLGYSNSGSGPVVALYETLQDLVRAQPNHPYARCGLDTLEKALKSFQVLCSQAGYPLVGSLENNWLLPTALGTLRPTCLAPETMLAGDLSLGGIEGEILIAGFERFGDFFPNWIAANLSAQKFPARGVLLDLAELKSLRFVTGRVLAQKFDTPEFREAVAAALKPVLGRAVRVGLPAVLGLRSPLAVLHDLQDRLGVPVFEIPTLPPSIPGIRLHNLLSETLAQMSVRIFEGMLATGAEITSGRVTSVLTEAAARRKAHTAHTFVLATGGILGGGLWADESSRLRELVFDLPLACPGSQSGWFHQRFLAEDPHPVYLAGLDTDNDFRPLGPDQRPVYHNLHAVGGALCGSDLLRERSLEGVALATAFAVGMKIAPQEQS
jgi:glycerol-3-phosphate dehydrogenase